MNWSYQQVIEWCKSFINDDSILSRFEGQFVYLLLGMHVFFDQFQVDLDIYFDIIPRRIY